MQGAGKCVCWSYLASKLIFPSSSFSHTPLLLAFSHHLLFSIFCFWIIPLSEGLFYFHKIQSQRFVQTPYPTKNSCILPSTFFCVFPFLFFYPLSIPIFFFCSHLAVSVSLLFPKNILRVHNMPRFLIFKYFFLRTSLSWTRNLILTAASYFASVRFLDYVSAP